MSNGESSSLPRPVFSHQLFVPYVRLIYAEGEPEGYFADIIVLLPMNYTLNPQLDGSVVAKSEVVNVTLSAKEWESALPEDLENAFYPVTLRAELPSKYQDPSGNSDILIDISVLKVKLVKGSLETTTKALYSSAMREFEIEIPSGLSPVNKAVAIEADKLILFARKSTPYLRLTKNKHGKYILWVITLLPLNQYIRRENNPVIGHQQGDPNESAGTLSVNIHVEGPENIFVEQWRPVPLKIELPAPGERKNGIKITEETPIEVSVLFDDPEDEGNTIIVYEEAEEV